VSVVGVGVCVQVQICVEAWSDGRRSAVERGRRSQRASVGGERDTRSFSDDQQTTPLSRLVRETRARLYATHDLWRQLPHHVCDELAVTPLLDNKTLCWDGHTYR